VRDLCPPLVEDRPLGGDLQKIAEELLGRRRLLDDVEAAL